MTNQAISLYPSLNIIVTYKIQIFQLMGRGKKNLVLLAVFCSLIFVSITQIPKTYVITQKRLESKQKACAKVNLTLLNRYETKSARHKHELNTLFNLDKIKYAKNLLDGKMRDNNSVTGTLYVSIIVFITPFCIGLVVMLAIWPCFLGCHFFPDSCPVEGLRKKNTQTYSKCELYWPTICAIVLLLATIFCCLAGLSKTNNLKGDLDNMLCSLSIGMDDLVNGNYDQNGSYFFAGLQTFITQLQILQSKLPQVVAKAQQAGQNSTTMKNLALKVDDVKLQVAKIPTGNPGQSMSLTYGYPLHVPIASQTGSMMSDFNDILGNSTASQTLVGAIFSSLDGVMASYKDANDNITLLKQNAPNFSNDIKSAKVEINKMINQIKDKDKNFLNLYKEGQNKGITNINIIIVSLFGIVILFSALMIISLIMFTYQGKQCCKKFGYVVFILLYLVGISVLLGGAILTILFPVFDACCQYFEYTFRTGPNFQLNAIFVSDEIKPYAAMCMPGQTGLILEEIAPTLSKTFIPLTNFINITNNYDPNYLLQRINSVYTNMTNYIFFYGNAIYQDISTNFTSLAFIQSLASNEGYSCSNSNFDKDSWVPSTQRQQISIKCRFNIPLSNSSVCYGSYWKSAGGGCRGCLDSFDLISSKTSESQVKSFMEQRYPQASCAPFIENMTNLWANYYLPKKTFILNYVETRSVNVQQTSLAQLSTSISQGIKTLYDRINTQLQTIAGSVTHNKLGIVGGLNCSLIGKEFNRVVNIGCTSVYQQVYILRITFGMTGIGILIVSCCTMCGWYRQKKHQDDLNSGRGGKQLIYGEQTSINGNVFDMEKF